MRSKGDRRSFRGFLAALVIFAFAAGACLEGLICGGDVAVAADMQAADAAADHDRRSEAAEHGTHGTCQHGHCHHGVGSVPSEVSASAPYAKRHGHRRTPAAGGAADRKFGLMRPPRA